ncbi:MAG: hypothetical protein MUF38_08415 [Anaerolineae bacterium]|nr:hypothetical protein [Anaerolineae bacterium]
MDHLDGRMYTDIADEVWRAGERGEEEEEASSEG